MELIRLRVNDDGILRLIGKWLNTGVMEEGKVAYLDKGPPQGGVISPLLSNIFLHYVLDDWFSLEVKSRMKGRCFIIRWDVDFTIGFESGSDTERLGKPQSKSTDNGGSGIFDFLGFTFYWVKDLKGYWIIKKKTARKRLNRMRGIFKSGSVGRASDNQCLYPEANT